MIEICNRKKQKAEEILLNKKDKDSDVESDSLNADTLYRLISVAKQNGIQVLPPSAK